MRAAVEIMRVVAAVLADEDVGVNAQMEGLELPAGETAPPAMKSVRNQADHEIELSSDERPDEGFPICVVLEDPEGITAEPEAKAAKGFRDGTLALVVGSVRDSAKKAKRWRESKYTAEAIVRALDNGLLVQEKLDAINATLFAACGIQILQATRLIVPGGSIEWGQTLIGSAVRIQLEFRDNAP